MAKPTAHGSEVDAHGAEGHYGPHIPELQGSQIKWHDELVFSESVSEWLTTTVLSTWILIVIIFIGALLFRMAIRKPGGKLKMAGLTIVRALDNFFVGLIGDKKFARKILFLLGGFFVYIVLANVFGLVIDWLSAFFPFLHYILRPSNSDLNTTLGMAAVVLILSHIVMIKYRGVIGYAKGYLFHWTGDNFLERCVNVFVGWLHAIGEVVRLVSLSFRLYGNIFAGLMLITIMVFLTSKLSVAGLNIGEVLTIPFWFFELFVAGIQTLVFCVLSAIYFQEAIDDHH